MSVQLDIGAFRTAFPEFADVNAYPTAQITFWAELAELQLRQCVWRRLWSKGVQLYVAHEITIAAQSAKTGKNDGAPGTFGGVANNKAVGEASVGYDSQSTSEKDAGFWNLTNYGKQLYRLMMMVGSGGVQL
jgi:hypothetical protein